MAKDNTPMKFMVVALDPAMDEPHEIAVGAPMTVTVVTEPNADRALIEQARAVDAKLHPEVRHAIIAIPIDLPATVQS